MDKYNIRNDKIKDIQDKIDLSKNASTAINIYGSSGTGKTFLVQEAIEKYFCNTFNSTIIYINLLEDILSTTEEDG